MTIRDPIGANLERLRSEFPLQARVESADAATREAYGTILKAWLQGMAPSADAIPQPSLRQLAALDAVVPTATGLACYPFTTANTGIGVEFGGHRVNAMCAIDALAIPFLARTPATIHARCAGCGATLRVRSDVSGLVEDSSPADVRVDYRQLAERHVACSQDLCPGIVFSCGPCVARGGSGVMTLDEAAAVGREFFRFQSALIRG